MEQGDLTEFISSVSGDKYLRVEEELGGGFVRLKTAEAERRQAKHDIRAVEDIVIEMLRNARDAGADAIFVATTRDGNLRDLTVIDDGSGVPDDMREHIFEPRVTSKLDSMVVDTWGVHGRGMALFSIRSNARDARVIESRPGEGSSFVVIIDGNELSERADQSTIPALERGDDGEYTVVRGPHNIARTVIEFAAENRHAIDVYMGSPADIVATMVAYGRRRLTDKELLFCDDPNDLPLCTRLGACTDAAELVGTAELLGLGISERTAHRVLGGQVVPQRPLIEQAIRTSQRGHKSPDIFKDSRGLSISKEDLDTFTRHLEDAFEDISERYYLNLTKKPKITVSGDSIHVRFDIEKDR